MERWSAGIEHLGARLGEPRMSGHLIHIGYTKTGSTSLQAWFQSRREFAYRANGIGGVHNAGEVVSQSRVASMPRWVVTSWENLVVPNGDDPINPPPGPIEARRRRVCERLRMMSVRRSWWSRADSAAC
jgi:hypothetical protein